MAITRDQIIRELRLGDTKEESEIATRLLKVAKEIVEKTAPSAPQTIKDEACIRLCAYLYDMPSAPRGTAYASALRNSGAKSLLLPYRAYAVGVAG